MQHANAASFVIYTSAERKILPDGRKIRGQALCPDRKDNYETGQVFKGFATY